MCVSEMNVTTPDQAFHPPTIHRLYVVWQCGRRYSRNNFSQTRQCWNIYQANPTHEKSSKHYDRLELWFVRSFFVISRHFLFVGLLALGCDVRRFQHCSCQICEETVSQGKTSRGQGCQTKRSTLKPTW